MGKHLKTHIIAGLAATCAHFMSLPSGSTPHTKGVCYFVPSPAITAIRGAMDRVADSSKRRIRVVVRPSRFRKGLHELYTYHFPKQWSAACQTNRELIKEAQRQAHALEHDNSLAALEYRKRFLSHYFRVFKGGEKPAEGMKAYSRFYQYTYVAIYRTLQAAQQAQKQEEITFEPIVPHYCKKSDFSLHHSRYGGTSDADCPLGIPPKLRSRPAEHMQIRLLFRRRRTPVFSAPIHLPMRA